MNRWVLVVIPFATCALVSIAVFVVGAPEARPAARLYGGPTEGLAVLAWSLEVTQRTGAADGPAPDGPVEVEVTVPEEGRRRWRGSTRGGRAELSIALSRPARGPLDVLVRDGSEQVLARGRVRLGRPEWWERARESGGWLDGRRTGTLDIDVAPARGVFVVDFAEPISVRVRRAGMPSPGARLELAAEGADVTLDEHAGTGPAVDHLDLVPDRQGWATAHLRPLGFDVELEVSARDEDATGRWSGALSVVAGALDAACRGDRLVVRSSIPRQSAFFSIISEHGRLGGGELRLVPGPGGAVGSAPIPKPAFGEPRLWAVVAAEPHLDSSGAVGWPIACESARMKDALPVAMTVADQMLLDGRPLVRALEAARQRRARILAGVFAAVAMALMAVLTLTQTTRARRRLEKHLAHAGQRDEDVSRVTGARHWIWVSVLAVFVIAIGYAIVALVAIARIG